VCRSPAHNEGGAGLHACRSERTKYPSANRCSAERNSCVQRHAPLLLSRSQLQCQAGNLEQRWPMVRGSSGFRSSDVRFDVHPMALHPTRRGILYARPLGRWNGAHAHHAPRPPGPPAWNRALGLVAAGVFVGTAPAGAQVVSHKTYLRLRGHLTPGGLKRPFLQRVSVGRDAGRTEICTQGHHDQDQERVVDVAERLRAEHQQLH